MPVLEVIMSTPASAPDDMALPQVGTALIPSAHDTELAAASRPTLDALVKTTGDLTLTVTEEGGTTAQIRISAPALRFLFAALSQIASGNAVSLLPLNEEVTTQQAADILNVSRPYLVALLEKGEMPFRKVGNQRRVMLQDVLAYKTRSDIDRRAAFKELAQLGQQMGVGYER
jgi:excisionase family DNA binding protein